MIMLPEWAIVVARLLCLFVALCHTPRVTAAVLGHDDVTGVQVLLFSGGWALFALTMGWLS